MILFYLLFLFFEHFFYLKIDLNKLKGLLFFLSLWINEALNSMVILEVALNLVVVTTSANSP